MLRKATLALSFVLGFGSFSVGRRRPAGGKGMADWVSWACHDDCARREVSINLKALRTIAAVDWQKSGRLFCKPLPRGNESSPYQDFV
jgi:hypothetical protein